MRVPEAAPRPLKNCLQLFTPLSSHFQVFIYVYIFSPIFRRLLFLSPIHVFSHPFLRFFLICPLYCIKPNGATYIFLNFLIPFQYFLYTCDQILRTERICFFSLAQKGIVECRPLISAFVIHFRISVVILTADFLGFELGWWPVAGPEAHLLRRAGQAVHVRHHG